MKSNPKEAALDYAPMIAKWVDSGAGRVFQQEIVCEDEWGEQFVKALCATGFAASGKREHMPCMCDEHNGQLISSRFYTVRVTKHHSF